MAVLVQKYGGTSVANAEKIRRACQRVINAVKGRLSGRCGRIGKRSSDR